MRCLFVFILIVVGLVIFLLFYAVPWAGEKAAALVPIETEVVIGEGLSRTYSEQYEVLDSATYLMNKFIDQLKLDETYDIDAKVVLSDDINAFALPGGKIFVYSGILEKMNSYEELVALLGHEVTHVVNRHSLKNICRGAATSLVISSLFGDLEGISAGILSKAEEFKQLDYSRDLETEADNNGFAIMLDNEVDPSGMRHLLELLKKEGTEAPAFMKYLSTHPGTDDRIANISARPEIEKDFPDNKKLAKLFKRMKAQLGS